MDVLLAQAQEPPAADAPSVPADSTESASAVAAAPPAAAVDSNFVATRRTAVVPAARRAATSPGAPEIARILKVRVPVIVRLARRLLPIATIRTLSNGAILEFEKSVEDD